MKRSLSEDDEEDPNKRLKVGFGASIEDLPTEILILIFEHLTPSHRRNAMTVCEKWLNVVNRYFEKDNQIVLTEKMSFSQNDQLYKTFWYRLQTTKVKRTFRHLLIKTLPNDGEELMKMSRFLELIRDDVEFLKIEESPLYDDIEMSENLFNARIYAKLPNLRRLEVLDDHLLGDLTFHSSLTKIKVNSEIYSIDTICDIKDIDTIKSLTCKEILLCNHVYKTIKSIFGSCLIDTIKEIIGNGNSKHTSLRLQSSYDFMTDRKMTHEDVTGLKFTHGIHLFTPSIANRFPNLRKVQLICYGESDTVMSTEMGCFTGIRVLELVGHFEQPTFGHLEKLLKSFPNLEYLKVTGFPLQGHHFTLICQYMPKLKELLLLNGSSLNEIPVKTILDSHHYSLKDLPYLKRLEIETTSAIRFDDDFEWPQLPKLTELRLIGDCFQVFNDSTFSEIGRTSPKIRKFELKTFSVPYISYIDIRPLILELGKALTHLSLPGEGTSMIYSNEVLVADVIENCPNLQKISIQDNFGFSFNEEMRLFRGHPALNVIKSEITRSLYNVIHTRKMTRNDFKDLKQYLVKNLLYYRNITQVANYVIDRVMSFEDSTQTLRAFEREHPMLSHDVKYLYVLTNYLKMNDIDLCELITFNLNEN